MFADPGSLIARLFHAVRSGEKLTFLFGSAVNAPGSLHGENGVPNAAGIIDEVINIFRNTEEGRILEQALSGNATERYQIAMQFLINCRGPNALNALIRSMVLKARVNTDKNYFLDEQIEYDLKGWHLRPATEAVGQLVTEFPNSFSSPILTSNFDPLIEVSIQRTGSHSTTIHLASDGQFTNILNQDTKVVHFHGFWRGPSDTLHTPSQLRRDRPQLEGGLRSLLRDTTLIVIGYGGWEDIFTKTLLRAISEQVDRMNVLWTFYSDNDDDIRIRNKELLSSFDEMAAHRVVLYKGVDCHVFLPTLLEKLRSSNPAKGVPPNDSGVDYEKTPSQEHYPKIEDLPPQTDIWVGREIELREMLSSKAKIILITGIGGSGKSALASKYIEWKEKAEDILFSCWADCREQTNTLHTQLVRMVDRLSNNIITPVQLKNSNTEDVIEILFDCLSEKQVALVFDNVDQYIDVDTEKAVGVMDVLIKRALERTHNSQLIFTGRPKTAYSHNSSLEITLSGLSVQETKELFTMRGAQIDIENANVSIKEVNRLTQGHALALNLIATQVAKNKISLSEITGKLKDGTGEDIEIYVLHEIWGTLNEKQQNVLRYLAELIHPETEERIASYLGNIIKFNQFSKAIRALKTLNLLVIRSRGDRSSPELLELHPLVRDFVRRRFTRLERVPYMVTIIHFCDRMIGRFRADILTSTHTVLEHWTDKVELCLECDQLSEAIEALYEVQDSLLKSGYIEEFIRLASLVIARYWEDPPADGELDWHHHDNVYSDLVRCLSALERYSEADIFIERLGKTIPGKTARYVFFCDIACYSFFLRADYERSKHWGTIGADLKRKGNLDTIYDCEQNLALAQRESGEVEGALKTFLRGRTVDSLIAAAPVEYNLGGALYGNVGRCLFYLNKLPEALKCFVKSASILENSNDSSVLMNRGWAAFWIGQTLESTGCLDSAYVAYVQASLKWRVVSPKRSNEAKLASENLRLRLPYQFKIPDSDAAFEKAFTNYLK